MRDTIFVKGARENNLKNVDVEIPREKLVVFTGLSGSGKSSLPLIPYMRKDREDMWNLCLPMPVSFWGQMEKPDVDYIGGFLQPYPSIRRHPQEIRGPP